MTVSEIGATSFEQFSYAMGEPLCSAVIKQDCEDFQVNEVLGFEPTGSGRHLFLKIRKKDMSTTEVAGHLADILDTAPVQIGYSGMKDRRAVTTQWFSVPENSAQRLKSAGFDHPGLELLELQNNDRKLRIGSHRANRFEIRLRQLQGDTQDVAERVEKLSVTGTPNYFGPQRLGREFSNVRQAQATFRGLLEKGDSGRAAASGLPRKTRSMLFSASRSFLFNHILSQRVADGSWNRLRNGEVLNLEGTRRFFKSEPADRSSLEQRLHELDIHPTGLLAGIAGSRDPYLASDEVASLEGRVLSRYSDLTQGLERCGVKASRRALRLLPRELTCESQDDGSMVVKFTLGAGGYATALLREIVRI